MIFHLKDGGAVRTQPQNPGLFECQAEGTTWTEKLDVWQDCAPAADVPNDEKVAPDVDEVKAMEPVRDPLLPRIGVVTEPKLVVEPLA